MRDVLRIVRFDFLTAKPIGLPIVLVVWFLCTLFAMFFSPMIEAYGIFAAMGLVIPLQRVADKSGLHKLYGVLPVERKNITRGRFCYIFLVHIISELTTLGLALGTFHLKLYRFLPNQEGRMVQMIARSYSDDTTYIVAVIGLALIFCLLFTYMEMMGQIFGRENEMKIILITLAVVSVILLGFFILSDHGIIPMLKLPVFPTDRPAQIRLVLILHIVLLGLSVLFGEITAHILAKREL